MSHPTRRDFLAALGTAALVPSIPGSLVARPATPPPVSRGVIVRTITAGVALERLSDRRAMERALATLARAKKRFQDEGYEVQTTRITLPPLVAALEPGGRPGALTDLRALDTLCTDASTMLGLGPVLLADRADDALAPWVAELVRATRSTSFSSVIASPAHGVHASGVRVAAAIARAVAEARPTGMGSFQYAAAANVPAGTPFFPVGWHDGPTALAVGLQSLSVVREAFSGARDRDDARRRLSARLTSELRDVERVAKASASAEGLRYGGIDSSPAPIGDDSIGGAIETLTGVPFGEAGTLQACALITDAIKTIPVELCGYSGLMLPVLEDKVLAARAKEGHFGLRDLLLFSSVCGTGLDVVPIPGDTPTATIERIMLDVAAQAVKLRKALSVRLFLVRGKSVGDPVRFDDPRLFETVVMKA
jgi:uncharacterized protein (UPF0210 family)